MDFAGELPDQVRFAEAEYAIDQIEKGNANGNVTILRFRAAIESRFKSLGCFIGRQALPTLGIVIVVCGLFSIGLVRAKFEIDEEELWAEKGGRLEDERRYTEQQIGAKSSSSNEVLIQEAKQGVNGISVEALDEHLKTVEFATRNVSVMMWGSEWSFRDICLVVSPPPTGVDVFDDVIYKKMNPCIVLSSLDCFWEGSFVHNPNSPVEVNVKGGNYDRRVTWSSLNTKELIGALSNASQPLDEGVKTGLEVAGFDGYTLKPCLHPQNPDCPKTAKAANITQALLDGCTGYASAAMIWPPATIVSGEEWRKTGVSKAVQAILRMLPEDALLQKLKFLRTTNVVQFESEPTIDDATNLLKEWRKEFSKRVYEYAESLQLTDIHIWTDDSATIIVDKFSSGSPVLLSIGYLLMLIYAGIAFVNIKSIVLSRVNVGLVGVILVMVSTLGGLGFSSACGIYFNPTTTQVLPFLVLGLGVDDMFVMAHAFFAIFDEYRDRGDVPVYRMTGECLKRVGHSITLTSVTNGAGFLFAAIVPIPAMRSFAFQVGICVIFNYFVILFGFSAYLSFDSMRVRENRWDFLCCFRSFKTLTSESSPPSKVGPSSVEVGRQVSTSTANSSADLLSNNVKGKSDANSIPMTTLIGAVEDPVEGKDGSEKTTCGWNNMGSYFVANFYSPFLQSTFGKVVVLLLGLGLLGAGLYGVTQVENGLDLIEVVPSGTREHGFVRASLEHFSFYDVTIVLDDRNDFAGNQKNILKFHNRLATVPFLLKKNVSLSNGPMVARISEEFWLQKMITFYDLMEQSYKAEKAAGKNAVQSFTILFMENVLLGQVGNGSYDQALASMPGRSLVEKVDGVTVIPEERYYLYLTAWNSMDVLNAGTSQPNFRPLIPKWSPGLTEPIDPAKPHTYAQMFMYANGLETSADMIELIRKTREVCEEAKEYGVYAYPQGSPYTYYEQYIGLQKSLVLSIGLIVLVCLLATSLLLLSYWTGAIMVLMLVTIAVEVYGFLGLAGIRFSAIPCVTVIVSVGAAVEFTAPMCLMYLKVTGSSNRRLHYSLMHRFVPIFNGAVSSCLGFIMLGFSEFDFIVKYFFVIFIALLVVGSFNGLVLLPVLLSLIGPPPQVVPVDSPYDMKGIENAGRRSKSPVSSSSNSSKHGGSPSSDPPPYPREGTPV